IARAQQHQLGWIQDIVPNHMAFSSENPLLIDLLENGPDSQYRDYFDINWEHSYESLRGRLLAPFLGNFYGECLENGELVLRYDVRGFSVWYYDWRFPLRLESYSAILAYNLQHLREKLGRTHPDFIKYLGLLYSLKYLASGQEGRERYDQIFFIKNMLAELWESNAVIRDFLEANLQVFNGEKGRSESFDRLDRLLREQFFRLAFWKVGNEELNYRRFFTVNDLISVRIEAEEVFAQSHRLTVQMVNAGYFTGLRVDHIDGLYDPKQYLSRLRETTGDTYIVVEKILEYDEALRSDWATQGTTGYEALQRLDGVFCREASAEEFTRIYHRFLGYSLDCEALLAENKRLIAEKHLAGDIDNLARLLKQLAENYRYTSDFTLFGLKTGLLEIVTAFPVYRTYICADGLSRSDREYLEKALEVARERAPAFQKELEFIGRFLLQEFDRSLPEEEREQWLSFARRLQQYTGPLMAKGLEDTVMYLYNRLLSLNEVGGSPLRFGISVEEFHQFNQQRHGCFPHGLTATATHDTKRGEDTRARLQVLSEIPEEWEARVQRWRDLNFPHKKRVDGRMLPAANDEYALYQTLLGAFPWEEQDLPEFEARVQAYVEKAVREGKTHSSWLRPDAVYEEALRNFVSALLTPNSAFLADFLPFQQEIARYGVYNSLSRTVLKLAMVGVPDFYQGCELWDLSLVDPDNRRPVDYGLRQRLLAAVKSQMAAHPLTALTEFLRAPADGKAKLCLIWRGLHLRQQYPEVFQRGEYVPLPVLGSLQNHVVAFARVFDRRAVVAIAPRFYTGLIQAHELPLGDRVWQENRLVLPPHWEGSWHNALTGETLTAPDGTLWLREALAHFPVALLTQTEPLEGSL
ncbi:MAG: malto-oligosyltrehalose synthase, partial [Pseudanabaenaceae cyanobacterium]